MPAVFYRIGLRAAPVMLRRQSWSERPGGREMAKTPRVGEQSPDFELPGTDGPFRLSDHRGERVVLLFMKRRVQDVERQRERNCGETCCLSRTWGLAVH
jgi:hypothetical protein